MMFGPISSGCPVRCSGSVKWIRIQKPSADVVVAVCNQTSCSSEEGFILSHHHYLTGNLSLTVTAADYRKRGWYKCQCDDKDMCDVSLRIKPVAFQTPSRPGGSLVMQLEVRERVKVLLNRSGGAEGTSSVWVPVCDVDSRAVQCEDEYKRRVTLKCFLTLSAVQETDGGVYSLWDDDNQEMISSHTLTLTGNHTDTNNTLPPKGELESWNMWRIFNEVVGGVLGVLVFLGLVNVYCHVRNRVRRWWRWWWWWWWWWW